MTKNIVLVGTGGGVGTSTLAALIAKELGRTLAAVDSSDGNIPAGFEAVSAFDELEQLVLDRTPFVLDAGHRIAACDDDFGESPLFLAVVRGPSFRGLQRALRMQEYLADFGHNLAGVLLVKEDGRALCQRDAEQVFALPVFHLPYSQGIARLDDAGILAMGKIAPGDRRDIHALVAALQRQFGLEHRAPAGATS